MNFETLLNTQKNCCEHYSGRCSKVGAERPVVISDSIYEGVVPVEGVRYPSPNYMSDWWLTTDEYSGNSESLKTVHFRHILEHRPELGIYMALPFGFRFFSDGHEENVWFDEDVAKESA